MIDFHPIPVVRDEDERIHTDEHPYCDDLSCMCHCDKDNFALLEQWQNDGLISAEDRVRIFTGRTLR